MEMFVHCSKLNISYGLTTVNIENIEHKQQAQCFLLLQLKLMSLCHLLMQILPDCYSNMSACSLRFMIESMN